MTVGAEPFRFPVRVYYEDTDAAGVVYYANYLRFMERARTEWLAAHGFDLARVEREHGVAFAVARAEVDYLAPARLTERLDVTVAPVELGRVRFAVAQTVERGAETLVRARITLVSIDRASWRPVRIPAAIAARMKSSLMETPG
jgi:acyl-CoA thioester hydrolase